MFPGLEAGQLEGALQLGLAPVTRGLLVTFECHGQVGRLGIHLYPDIQHLADLGFQGALALDGFRVYFVDTALEAVDLLAERFEQRLQRLPAGGRKALAFILENPVGKILEFPFEVFPRLVE